MLNKTHKPKNGFTIIEIMIVLAIAGLIMLIVFLAVPALQRSARNTQRKSDSAAIAAAVGNFISDNAGSTPLGVGIDAGDASAEDVCNLAACAAGSTFQSAKLGYYTPGPNITISVDPAVAPAAVTNLNDVEIVTGWGCNATETGVSTNAISRNAAILYAVESSSSNVGAPQCVEQ
jgi:prepilin-type N-terminal cleavage/methylation domain-containing protein